MDSYEHITEYSPSPPARARAALRATRLRPARIAAAVVGGQLCATGLAAGAPGVMGVTVAGPLNVGLTLVLVQLCLTSWAVVWYGRYGREEVDAVTARHRAASRYWGRRR